MNKFIVMSQIKKIVGPAGVNFLKKIRDFVNFYRVYRRDRLKYQKHSSVYNVDTFEKLESEITLLYHGIEKGFLHDNIRPYFARAKVISLLKLIDDRRIDKLSWERSHLQSAAANLCNYYEWHSSHGYNLDYFPEQMYIDLCQHLVEKLPSFIQSNKEDYFAQIESPFSEFAKSRSSVREFSDEMVSREILEKVVELANTAPSVCNRQGVSVVVVEDKKIIEKILDIQKGLAGYTSINQLIVLTANRNYFYSVGERNQLYVDGGIYLMNLLYALHSYGIAACTAHWGLLSDADSAIEKLIGLPPAAQVICIVSFGYPKEIVKRTLSLRRKANENLTFIGN